MIQIGVAVGWLWNIDKQMSNGIRLVLFDMI